MSDEKQTAVDLASVTIDRVADVLTTYTEAAKQVIDQYGPDAVDLALNVARVDAAAALVPGVVVFLVLAFLAHRAFLFASRRVIRKDSNEGDAFGAARRAFIAAATIAYTSRSGVQDRLISTVINAPSSSFPAVSKGHAVGVFNNASDGRKIQAATLVDSGLEADDPLVVAGYITCAVSSFIALLAFFSSVVDVWAWVGIFYPELYLTKQALAGLL